MQNVISHSFGIAERYSMIDGTSDKTKYVGTWRAPLVNEIAYKALHELLSLHLGVMRVGEKEAILRKKIEDVEYFAKEGETWAQDVLINLEFFNEKYMASQFYPSNFKVPFYEPDCYEFELLGILDKRKKDLLLK